MRPRTLSSQLIRSSFLSSTQNHIPPQSPLVHPTLCPSFPTLTASSGHQSRHATSAHHPHDPRLMNPGPRPFPPKDIPGPGIGNRPPGVHPIPRPGPDIPSPPMLSPPKPEMPGEPGNPPEVPPPPPPPGEPGWTRPNIDPPRGPPEVRPPPPGLDPIPEMPPIPRPGPDIPSPPIPSPPKPEIPGEPRNPEVPGEPRNPEVPPPPPPPPGEPGWTRPDFDLPKGPPEVPPPPPPPKGFRPPFA